MGKKRMIWWLIGLFCVIVLLLIVISSGINQRKKEALNAGIEALNDEMTMHPETILPGGEGAEAFAERLREVLLASSLVADSYKNGSVDFEVSMGGLYYLEDHDSKPSLLADVTGVLRNYVENAADVIGYHASYTWLAENMQPVLPPVLLASETASQHQIFIRDLYAYCCVGTLAMDSNDERGAEPISSREFDLESWYDTLARPTNSEMRQMLLDTIVKKRSSLAIRPLAILEVYALHEYSHTGVREVLRFLKLNDALDGSIWNSDDVLRFCSMLSRLDTQQVEWRDICDKVLAKKEDDGYIESALRLFRDAEALSISPIDNWRALGEQYYRIAYMHRVIDESESLKYTDDLPEAAPDEALAELLTVLTPEVRDRIEGLRPNDRNLYIYWTETSLAKVFGQKPFRPAHPLSDGYILMSTDANEYRGIRGSKISAEDAFNQCEKIDTLMSCEYIGKSYETGEKVGTLVADPNDARVGIVFTCTYPSNGMYQIGNRYATFSAYACEVYVRAIDLLTGDKIAEVECIDDSVPLYGQDIKGSYYSGMPILNMRYTLTSSGEKQESDTQEFRNKVAAYMENPL